MVLRLSVSSLNGGGNRTDAVTRVRCARCSPPNNKARLNAEVAQLRGPVEDAVNAYNEALKRRCALLNVHYAPIATKFRVAAE